MDAIQSKGVLWRSWAAALANITITGMLLPVMPVVVREFTDDTRDAVFWYGACVALIGMVNVLCAPMVGALSDALGRRPVLVGGFVIRIVSQVLIAGATHRGLLVLACAIGGLAQSVNGVLQASIADVTPEADRSKRFGMLGAAMGLGFIVGPLLGGLVGAASPRNPFYLGAALAAVCAIGILLSPESLVAGKRTAMNWHRASFLTTVRDLLQLRGFGVLVLVILHVFLAQFITMTTWALDMQLRFGWGPRETGWSMFVLGMTIIIAQGALLRVLEDRLTRRQHVLLSLLASVAAGLGYALAPHPAFVYLAMVPNFLGNQLAPLLSAIVSQAGDDRSQGRLMGAYTAISSLASALAPILGSAAVYAVSGLPTGDWRLGAPFFVSATCSFIALLLARRYFARHDVLAEETAC